MIKSDRWGPPVPVRIGSDEMRILVNSGKRFGRGLASADFTPDAARRVFIEKSAYYEGVVNGMGAFLDAALIAFEEYVA